MTRLAARSESWRRCTTRPATMQSAQRDEVGVPPACGGEPGRQTPAGAASDAGLGAVSMQREDVWFNSGSDRISAWLYRPTGNGDAPLLVMAHGLGAVRTMRLDAYAERFSAAGYACLVFDYRNFGDSEGEPRQLLDINMQLADWACAVGYARGLPGVDRGRIALWGTSFGGGHVIASAARLPGIAAAVAQCPFTDSIASLGRLSPLISARITALAIRDLIGARFGRPPVMVRTAGHP